MFIVDSADAGLWIGICSNFLSKQCSDLQRHLEVKGAAEPILTTNKWEKATNIWNKWRLVRELTGRI